MGYDTYYSDDAHFTVSPPLPPEKVSEFNNYLSGRFENPERTHHPGYYCDLTFSSDGSRLELPLETRMLTEKWLEWVSTNMLEPQDHLLNGEQHWIGDNRGDVGKLVYKDNKLTVYDGIIYKVFRERDSKVPPLPTVIASDAEAVRGYLSSLLRRFGPMLGDAEKMAYSHIAERLVRNAKELVECEGMDHE